MFSVTSVWKYVLSVVGYETRCGTIQLEMKSEQLFHTLSRHKLSAMRLVGPSSALRQKHSFSKINSRLVQTSRDNHDIFIYYFK